MTTYLCVPSHSAPLVAEGGRYHSLPGWSSGQRSFDSAKLDRLNKAHWTDADDQTINVWLASQLVTIRSRAIYEHRNNATVQGVVNTFADDVVGQDGPVLQVQSDNGAYNQALETVWRDWWKSPTTRSNISGATLLKLWVRSLWKCGEFVAQIVTDRTADGPVQMRLRTVHPRRLVTPSEMAGNTDVCMGIRFDELARPSQYYLADSNVRGLTTTSMMDYQVVPPDLMIHEFTLEEEDQARGVPWLNPCLQTAADLRDYDDQVQDAARQMADQSSLLYTDHPDAVLWEQPEEVEVERRSIRMVPPGWKPFTYAASQPPVQYPEYRAEKQRDYGRPVGMPLLMVRLDASRHNYSSARLDTQVYRRSVGGIQTWISGSERSYGTLNRLVDVVAAEARFSQPELRNRPEQVTYHWTWPQLPHVDPTKETQAESQSLENGTETLTGALAARGRDAETHIATLVRERKIWVDAGLAPPPWLSGGGNRSTNREDAEEAMAEAAAEAVAEATD